MTFHRPQPGLRPAHVTFIVPAKDEARAIGPTLTSLPHATLAAMGLTSDVLVLDGRSRDQTAAIATAQGARVVTDRDRGKGAAVRNAVPLLVADWAVMLDGDGTYAADAIPRLLAPLLWGEADVVMGRRVPLPGSMPRINRAGNAALSASASALYGRRCRDVCTGLWAFRVSSLQAMPLRSRSFGLEAELFALSARLGLRIATVDVDYLPRAGPTKLHWARDGARIARRLVRSRFMALRPGDRPPAVAAESSPEVA